MAGSPWVTGPESRLIRIVLHAVRDPMVVNGKTYDREIACKDRRRTLKDCGLPTASLSMTQIPVTLMRLPSRKRLWCKREGGGR
jgi:hypothetical protein